VDGVGAKRQRMELDIAACDAPPPDLRARYFESLPAPQVHYVEERVALARTLRFGPANGPLGYMAIHDGAVVEFYAAAALLPQICETFEAVAGHGGASSAVIKSYDALALVAATGRPLRATTIGVNCTAWTDDRFESPQGFAPRVADAADFAFLTELSPGLFERPETEIPRHLAAREITIYELDGTPVGCGICTPVRAGADAFDLGVGVHPDWRRRGLGEQIMRHLKRRCLTDLRGQPTCGCAVENVASRRTLERAGFLTEHRVLELTWA
jgi:GNAT superfamily N-acetyltransferase